MMPFKTLGLDVQYVFCNRWDSPQDWDKPENIPDPDAKKPDDWDEEMDGEWEPPMIPNPEYKVHPTCRIPSWFVYL